MMLLLTAVEAKRNQRFVCNCSDHFHTALNSFKQNIICASFQLYGTGKRLVQSLLNAGEQSKAAVKTAQKLSE
jgi:hypothetical protein